MKDTQNFSKAIGTLAALGVAAAIGLASATAEEGPHSLPTDANARRAPGIQTPAPISTPAGRGELDPALGRVDANDHHG